MSIREILKLATVIPVIELDCLEDAAPLSEALASGGIQVMELTLRTEAALPAISVIKRTTPCLIVGVGTIRNADEISRSLDAGAEFLVSPGATPALLKAFTRSRAPTLPGIATPSEAMTAADAGFDALKFFPAEAAGGVAFLRAIEGPLPSLQFCPTGGITQKRAREYLALANVACVGGSWIAPRALIAARDWNAIKANARFAQELRQAAQPAF